MDNDISTSLTSQRDGTQEYEAVSRRLNRKMDIALLPFLSILYLFNGLDRSNIGNAETQGTWKASMDSITDEFAKKTARLQS
jgi:hypothetical protein